MAQKQKAKPAAAKGKRKSGLGSANWQGRRTESKTKLLALIALVGVVAMLASYFLQNAVFAANDAPDANQSTVRINEIVSENMSTLITEAGDVPDWVEITNTGSQPVDIGKYVLMVESGINKMFSFPDYSLQPGECLVVRCEGSDPGSSRGEFSAAFKLDASGGDTLVLMNARNKAIDAVVLPELDADAAYRRLDDGSWEIGGATPGKDNNSAAAAASAGPAGVQVVADSMELTEVMSGNTLYFADENGEVHDYVEVHNRSGRSVNLKGWFLSDSSDKIKRWAFPDVTIPADGYLAVHCSGYNRTDNPDHLHTDFKIGSDGENIYLSRPDGHTVSVIETPVLQSNQAYSLELGVWDTELAPTPGAPNTADWAAQVHLATFGDRTGGVYISEAMASPNEEDYDWVEIYNGSGQVIDLSNYGLSDSPDKPRKWQFPQGTAIQPGQYMVICLSGTDAETIGGFLNGDFSLSSSGGGTVTLSGPDGRVFDAAYLPRQYGGASYGRVSGQNGFFFFESGSPGTANGGARYRSRAKEVKASVQGGLYTGGESFTVTLSAPEGSRIYYTLDCSDPTESSTLYTGPIQISGTTILRSRAFSDGCMPSFIDTQSYLYDVAYAGATYVVSVVSDPVNLYSDESGIMVMGLNPWPEFPYGKTNQGANFWMDWEREGHVELFEADGDVAVSQGCGLKLHGQYSRATDVKAFKVIARSQYGDNRFDYPIFSDRDYTQYQSFVLRASGQDYDKSFMRDSVLTSLAADTSLLFQETEIGVCYLNGEYYSLFNLRERINKYSICQFEGWEGMENDIDLIKANDIEMQGSNASFEELLAYIKSHDMSTQAAYDYLDSKIDIQNYIEYMAVEIFVGNGDTLNVKRYRNAKDDGKWRWVLFDLDWGFYEDTNSINRWQNPEGMGTGKYTDTTLFIGCLKNPIFKERFLTYMGEQMATTFASENVMRLFQERYEIIEPLLPAYRAKWNISEKKMQSEMSRVLNYIKTRPTQLLTYFQGSFNFSEADFNKYFGAAVEAIENYAAKEGTNS